MSSNKLINNFYLLPITNLFTLALQLCLHFTIIYIDSRIIVLVCECEKSNAGVTTNEFEKEWKSK